jgi:uncharacterized protein (TIGR03435 family)
VKHRILRLVCAALIGAAGTHSQTPANRLAFEVTSVKPSQPGGTSFVIRPMPGGQTYIANNVTLRQMITLMYKITDSQLVGGPAWMDTDRWDVNAKAEQPSNIDQLHEMFQSLFAERFKLRFHHETREAPAYVLSVDKSGSKLKLSDSQEPFDIPIKPGDRPGKSVGTRVPMSYLCWYLSQQLNVPVVDKTGLAGYYDFTLELAPPPPLLQRQETLAPVPGPAPDRPDLAGDFIAAIREQLGLKLESRKAPVDAFVIDHVERPTEN